MRRLSTALLLSVFVLISVGVGHVSAQKMPYETPWIETDLNSFELINNGYEIVGTSFALVGYKVMEVLYLKKKNKLYRCHSLEDEEKSGGHGCLILTEPKKN